MPKDAFAPVAGSMAGDDLGRGDDMDARLENADQIVDVGEHLVAHHAIGLEFVQRVDVVCGQHAEWFDAAQFPDVAPTFSGDHA